jgi:outer membrane protein assembly factor BamB
VYFGDGGGTVYALSASTGHVQWTYHASGPVKGGPALVNGILYFGDYNGKAYAVDARTGHQVWAVTTEGARFGFGSGNFYATPAVAFGRVYLGNTDGRVYSFAARTGQLAWATGTSAYVYSSAAVADPPGVGPTVYVGSYDGHMYAFDARSGSVRWSNEVGGKISGAGTIVNNILYFSNLSKQTFGLDVRTGHRVFTFPDGAFNPVIADHDTIYLDGYGAMYQMRPAGSAHSARKAAPKSTSTRKKRR